MYYQAMLGPHREEFKEVMGKEVAQLKSKKTWNLVPQSANAKVLPGTCVLKSDFF